MNSTRKHASYLLLTLALSGAAVSATPQLFAQAAPAKAPVVTGTVKAISGSTITVAPDAAPTTAVTATSSDATKVQVLAPNSTDLKTATAAVIGDLAVGDRVIIQGHAGDAATALTAARVIMMKSGDIAARNAAIQEDWKRNGTGGLVTAVDAASGTITVSAGPKKTEIHTAANTIYKRYAADSTKYEATVPGTLASIHAGDQLQVRGTKSPDGTSITAAEIVSGAFLNLSGIITQLDAAAGTFTIKDLTTKKSYTVKVTPNSDLRDIPAPQAAMVAAAAHPAPKGDGAAGGPPAGGPPAGGGAPGGGGGQRGPGGPGGRRGADLGTMFPRLPTTTLAALKSGQAVMIVATEAAPNSGSATAVTLLTGVEPILAASPAGAPQTLAPWSIGGGAPGGGGDGGGL